MSKSYQSGSPRRAAAVDAVANQNTPEIELEATTDPVAPARRGRRPGRRVIAGMLASVLAALTLFGYAFSMRGSDDDLSSENVNEEVAVPQAAIDAAERGFADRGLDASRNSVRSELNDAVAGASAGSRETTMDEYVMGAYKVMGADAAAERDKKMDADMEAVNKQAAQLKKEAEEAARRLEAARKAAAAAAAGSPDVEVSADDLAVIASKGGSMPLKSGYRIGASFGQRGSWSRYHTGQDFPAPIGTPIYAAASGIVLSPTSGGWAGTNVVIQHSNGGSTLYAHMSRKVVSTGQAVKAGQLIGYVGVSGRSFGAHLHMEYYKPGVTPGKVYEASDPMAFLRSLGVR